MRTLILCTVALAGCDGLGSGVAAYEDGRYEDAHAEFARAAASAGGDASPELLHNHALAALRVGALREAEASAKEAAARGAPEMSGPSDFLLGNVAFARSELAEAQASTPEAEPFAFDIAIHHAKAARTHWQRAAASRPDWPEARRNVERAIVQLDELERKKAQKRNERKKASRPAEKRLVPPRPPDRPDDEPEAARTPEAQLAALSPEQVARLFETLARKEQEKIAVRRARRDARRVEVEKDW